jgi:hypothetical protein
MCWELIVAISRFNIVYSYVCKVSHGVPLLGTQDKVEQGFNCIV